MPARSARSSEEVQTADVDLFAHEQFPELSFGARNKPIARRPDEFEVRFS